ncbi:MAG: FRG1-like family-domain-containing protein [Benniella sp.]|nr:MAG: FRG1-like family-domain-containing protein [Benniella sp.]
MSDYAAKKTKLSFKGESSKPKKKKRKAEEEAQDEDTSSKDGWVPIKSLNDLGGPIFLTFSSDPPMCLAVDDKFKVTMQPLGSSLDEEESSSNAPVSFDMAEPTAVAQVFVVTMIPDSDRLTLKTHNGRYLSADKFGIVSADSEAIGMREEWTVVVRTDEEGGICLQSHYGKFLSVDEVAAGESKKGSSSSSAISGPSTKFQVRADSDVIGFGEIFQAKIQARFRKKVKKTNEARISTKDYEFEQSRKFQTWNHGRVVVSQEDSGELRKAKKEGRMSEALLDRREKLKSDRYCK